jgi:hypothetical protein
MGGTKVVAVGGEIATVSPKKKKKKREVKAFSIKPR